MQELRRLAEPLQGRRVVHVSATAFGGGVAEINYTLVPLMADVGLDVEWRIIHGADEFFNVTKAIHNGLQGDPRSLTDEERAVFARYNAANAAELAADDYDVVIVHDPQPIALIDHFPAAGRAKWVWRGHIDFSDAQPRRARRAAAVAAALRRGRLPHARVRAARAPAFPTCTSGRRRSTRWRRRTWRSRPRTRPTSSTSSAIDVERPLLTQVSRFDPWKDPLGVIDAYRLVKQAVPAVQLALVGSMAHDDPEGWDYYSRTVDHARWATRTCTS